MSNLAYTRPLGVWNPGVVYALELADLDAKTVKAPNFAEGGTYAPSATVYVGGSGMQIKIVGASSLDSGAALDCLAGSFLNIQAGGYFQLIAGSTANVAGQLYLTVGSNTDIFGAVHLRSGAGYLADPGSNTFLNGSVAVGGNIGFSSNVHFDSTSVTVCDGQLAVNGTFNISGSTAFGSQPIFAAGIDVRNVALMKFAGRVVKRPPILLSSVATDLSGYGPANCDTIFIGPSVSSITLSVDLGQNGDEFTVINTTTSGTHVIFVKDASTGSTVVALSGSDLSGSAINYRSATLVQVSGTWQLLRKERA